jgi:hypothetical protein
MKRFNPTTLILPLCGLGLLATARAQEATPGKTISLPAIVSEITTSNPELKFYEAEIAGEGRASRFERLQ